MKRETVSFIVKHYGKLIQIWLINMLNRPIVRYGLSYFGLLLLYALIYTAIPGHFYYASLQNELSIQNERDSILRDFREQIVKEFVHIHGSSSIAPPSHPYGISITDLEMKTIRTSEVEIRIDMVLPYRRVEKSDQSQTRTMIETGLPQLRLHLTLPTKPAGSDYPSNTILVQVEAFDYGTNNGGLPIDEVFPCKGQPDAFLADRLIPMSPDIYDRLLNYEVLCRGLPEEAPKRFFRMLYFSTVTIATVGYGDIVPVSGIARLLAGLESIAGVVVIGLFINAVSKDKRHCQPTEKN